jgi:cell division protein FtsL
MGSRRFYTTILATAVTLAIHILFYRTEVLYCTRLLLGMLTKRAA